MIFKHEKLSEDSVLVNNEFIIDGLHNIDDTLNVHHIIYKITNRINGRYYIGQHITNNPLDAYMGSGLLLKRAQHKYGRDNFRKTILFDFATKKEMDDKERELVNEETCVQYNPSCYNLVSGGSGGNKVTWTEEKRKQAGFRNRENQLGSKNSFYHKHHTKETKEHLSEVLQGDKNPAYNKVWLYHEQTHERVYVDKENVQHYLDMGYKMGIGLKWYTDGVNNIRAFECPDGYVHGRLKTWK